MLERASLINREAGTRNHGANWKLRRERKNIDSGKIQSAKESDLEWDAVKMMLRRTWNQQKELTQGAWRA
ncbi:hypothetical protein BDZ97DRAFT_587654 [Flammula alnicola]|nr:hypothetical protein BDZ97DRAFT_587654 [Flammula alnicola]